ncbi:ParB/RepB/Spo0J family partition protein [Caballeronia sp. LZ065]|uniref:ParB/RepB/Spo0J family partition protein n=1 Tax=Caballeronia sp. LZ065 TaxID=3038571 RepID=UPI00285B4D96|nr:ParB/RepB/Spo0J family partition protein [Caballeronia sp. LZ065]MDR5781234.1 ParB/RepB/Spo0J family partition protein [Caballeronia sp. LZ065]
MSMAKRMAERTSNIQAESTKRVPVADVPRTSTGRLLDVQLRVNEAIDRAESAEAKAVNAEAARQAVEQSLADARKQLEALATSSSSAAKDLDINTLVEVEGRRRMLSADEYAELRANLAASELMHPIVFRPLGDGQNEIISGHNRVSIYRELGRSRIKAVPFTGSKAEAEMGAAFSNLLAPSLPDFEKYRQFVRMRELSGLSQTDIIRLSGLTQGHVARIFSFANLPAEARELISKNPHCLGGNAAQKLAMLSEQGHVAMVIDAVKKLVEDPTLTQEKAIALASPKAQKAPAPQVQTFNRGKRKICDMSVRSGVIALRFSGKQGETVASEWSEKIAEYIRSHLLADE